MGRVGRRTRPPRRCSDWGRQSATHADQGRPSRRSICPALLAAAKCWAAGRDAATAHAGTRCAAGGCHSRDSGWQGASATDSAGARAGAGARAAGAGQVGQATAMAHDLRGCSDPRGRIIADATPTNRCRRVRALNGPWCSYIDGRASSPAHGRSAGGAAADLRAMRYSGGRRPWPLTVNLRVGVLLLARASASSPHEAHTLSQPFSPAVYRRQMP